MRKKRLFASALCIFFSLSVFAQTPTGRVPDYPGGDEALNAFINSNLRQQNETKGLKGTVTVSFDVKPDSTLSGVTVVSGLHPGIDEQVVRMLERSRFTPAQKDGRPIRMNIMCDIPILGKP